MNIGIFNLSGYNLGGDEINVLRKGLKFAPSHSVDKFQVYVDLQKFKRKLCLKKFFLKTPIERTLTNESSYTSLKNKSMFYPKHMISDPIRAFESLVLNEIERIPEVSHKKKNLTKKRKRRPTEFKDNKEIIIKPADKERGIVIMSPDNYRKESVRLLTDITTYQKIANNPMEIVQEKIRDLLEKGMNTGILSEKESDFIYVQHPRIPVFYWLQKLHKYQENPPRRPILSGIESASSHLSRYIDVILQPLVKSTPSYLKDSMNTLQVLEEIKWEKGMILATCDVQSLYTIIPHHKGCQASRKFMELDPNIPKDLTEFVIEGIDLLLRNNFFKYEEQYYLQTRGTTMGTRFAPSYANLFIADWEDQFIYGGPDWVQSLVLFRRYIDDIL
uniref:Reverse transcriptase domain-containing protein n=1 Tax=Leptobrachium leishanense TaxID=445787 RepID=A0A8C5LWU5_9ANUR